MNVKKRWPEE